MPRIAILDDYQNVAGTVADWSSLTKDCAIETFTTPFAGEAAAVAALKDFDIIVAMRERTPFPASLVKALPRLRLLVTTGMRNAAIDMASARAQGIDVCGTGILSYPAAELVWALILALIKNIPREDRAMREGRWHVGLADGLKGKTLGVLGLGRLGSQVAAVGLAFGMAVIAWSQNLTEARANEVGAKRVDKDALFRDSDILTIHVVLSARTRGLVGEKELRLMKPTAYLVNTARGPIVDEAALVRALEEKWIAGAGLDVYDKEPLPSDHPLRLLDNTVLTGHTGYVTTENYRLMYGEAVEDIRAWLTGKPIRLLNGP